MCQTRMHDCHVCKLHSPVQTPALPLQERRRLAILAGDLIDLADDTDDEAAAGAGGAGGAAAGAGAYGSAGAAGGAVQSMRAQRDAEWRRLLEQADAEEMAAAAAAETRRQEERRAKLQTALVGRGQDRTRVANTLYGLGAGACVGLRCCPCRSGAACC